MRKRSLLIGGTLSIDTIITPTTRRDNILGGSAAFCAVAAKLFAEQVDILSVVGEDFPESYRQKLLAKGIGLGAVRHQSGPSFAWTGEYFDNMNRRKTVSARDDVMVNWEPVIPEPYRDHDIIVLSCMVPERQGMLLDQCRKPSLVLCDSMDKWLRRQPDALKAVMCRSHINMMNENEAKEFAGTSSLLTAAEYLLAQGSPYAIVKLGEFGSLLASKHPVSGCTRLFQCPPYHLRDMQDPTGAGDSFLGALAGYLSGCDYDTLPSWEDMQRAMMCAATAASFTCESFSADSLLDMTPEAFQDRLRGLYDSISIPAL